MASCAHSGRERAQADSPGCASREDREVRLRGIQSAGLIPLDVREYEVSADGTVEPKDEWSAKARGKIERELLAGFQSRRIDVRKIRPQPDTAEELDELRLLNEAISLSADFPATQFDASVGPVGHLLDLYRVDALIFVWARGRLVTAGRQAAAAFVGPAESNAVQSRSLSWIDRVTCFG